jgi:hypothetical protein
MLRLPISPDRFREAIMMPRQPQPVPQPMPQPSPWPLVGMFGLGLAVGLALGRGSASELVREQLRQMGGRVGTTAGGLMTPIRLRAGLGDDRFPEPEAVPVVPPGPSDLPPSP